jgi:hypothetical protein
MFLGNLKTTVAIVLMLGATSVNLADEPGKRQDEKKEPPIVREVTGTLVGFDSASNRVTVTEPLGNEKSYELARAAVVLVDGKEGRVINVPGRTELKLQVSADDGKVLKLIAEGPRFGGEFTEWDREHNTLTLQNDRSRHTFNVNPDLAMKWPPYGNRPSPQLGIDSLRRGQSMAVILSVDRKRVARISLGRGRADRVGRVGSIDTATRRLVLREGPDAAPKETSHEVRADALIWIDGGKNGKLTDLAPECIVELKFDRTTKQVVEIWAMGPPMHADLHHVDAAKRTFSIIERKEVRTFAVPPDARIIGPGERDRSGTEIKFEELKAGQRVELFLTADGKSVVAITRTRR